MPWSTLQNPSGAALTVRPLRDGAPVPFREAGAGVSWLHVRLDDRPKYYRHAAYRRG